jgi:hypothetical protein
MVRSIVSSVQKYDNSLWLPEAFAPFTKNPYFKMLIFFFKIARNLNVVVCKGKVSQRSRLLKNTKNVSDIVF